MEGVADSREILTVGHSTHPIDRFVSLLRAGGAEAVADVRRYPGSRRYPQFNAGPLADALGAAGIEYERFGDELGGRRRASARSAASSGWRNRSFAAYAEYMESDEFRQGLRRLETLGGERRTVLLCAEADWRRCHRRLIAAALVAHGWRVLHLRGDGRREEHPPTLGQTGDANP